ncbi:MAG: hypothetical protein K9J13_01525 [Saprospiraceae bacterium]|nr:hypothetical protein [Saprospiraceae bacterium]
MYISVFLIISVVLQLIAAILALRLIPLAKARISWILVSIGLFFIVVKRVYELMLFFTDKTHHEISLIAVVFGIVSTILIIIGVARMGEVFHTLKQAEKERLSSERQVLAAIINTEEKDRKKFAADLHDGLGPILSTIKLYTDLIKKGDYQKIKSEKIISNIDELVNNAITVTKELSYNIMPNILHDFGLSAAIKEFCNYINETKSMNISVDTENYKIENIDFIEAILYQITKELINNTLKHASANNISVKLENDDSEIRFTFEDDGKGFDINEARKANSGLGINNIYHKAKTINGEIDMKSHPEKGMSVLLKVSLTENQ